MTMMNVKIKKLYKDSILPKYQTDGSVGMDLHAYVSERELPIILETGKVKVVNTGIAIQVPDGYEATVRSRSGLASRGIFVINSPGTIDPDYTGEVKVLLTMLEDHGFGFIKNGDRIAQLVFSPVCNAQFEEVDRFVVTGRGSGGIGSTGL